MGKLGSPLSFSKSCTSHDGVSLFRQSPIVFKVNLQNPVSMQPQIVRKYTIIYNMAHMLLPTFALEYSCRFTSPGSALHKCSRNLSLQRFLMLGVRANEKGKTARLRVNIAL